MRQESRNSLLARIHIAKKDMGLPDDVYRDMVRRIGGPKSIDPKTGKPSAGKLTHPQLVAMIVEFRAKGWNSNPPAQARKPKAQEGGEGWLSKINALRLDMGLEWDYVHSIGRNMFGTEKVDWLAPLQLRAVCVALIKKAEAKKAKEAV